MKTGDRIIVENRYLESNKNGVNFVNVSELFKIYVYLNVCV